MVIAKLTNGFGNNIFQYVAARQLAEFHNKKLFLLADPGYYAIDQLKQMQIENIITELPKEPYHQINDNNYLTSFSDSLSNQNFFLNGYFENHTYYGKNIDIIKNWFPKVKKRKDNDLVMHFRGTDRLLYNNIFSHKAEPQAFLRAVESFNFNRLHIVTDMPTWGHITVSELKNMSLHVGVPSHLRIAPEKSVQYFNSFIDTFAHLDPIVEKRSIVEDFNFIRTFDNILFEHGTLGWWAAALSEASSVGVYGPWRAWKGNSNKNLSNINLPGWFKWE